MGETGGRKLKENKRMRTSLSGGRVENTPKREKQEILIFSRNFKNYINVNTKHNNYNKYSMNLNNQ